MYDNELTRRSVATRWRASRSAHQLQQNSHVIREWMLFLSLPSVHLRSRPGRNPKMDLAAVCCDSDFWNIDKPTGAKHPEQNLSTPQSQFEARVLRRVSQTSHICLTSPSQRQNILTASRISLFALQIIAPLSPLSLLQLLGARLTSLSFLKKKIYILLRRGCTKQWGGLFQSWTVLWDVGPSCTQHHPHPPTIPSRPPAAPSRRRRWLNHLGISVQSSERKLPQERRSISKQTTAPIYTPTPGGNIKLT